MTNDDQLDRALERLLEERSPRAEVAGLSDEEQRMVRLAQLLRGSRGREMSPEFADRLHARLFPRRLVSRRTAFLSGLGALAAGVAAGFGIDRGLQGSPSTAEPAGTPLVGANGRWIQVASLADVPDGAIRPFTAGAVQGFLIRQGDSLRALSRICTHMGCALRVDPDGQSLECPCHGAEFDLQGRFLYGFGNYTQSLPPLPQIKTRVKGEAVEVFAV